MVPGRVTTRSCQRTALLFGPYARHLWKLDTVNLLFSFFINFSFGVYFSLKWIFSGHNLQSDIRAELFIWQCLVPFVSMIVSTVNLLAYFKPKRFFYSSLPALHPIYTLVVSLLMTHAWAFQAVGYWEGPIVHGAHWLGFKDRFEDVSVTRFDTGAYIIAKTVFAVVLFEVWLSYAFLSATAIALMKHGKPAESQHNDTEAPIELSDQIQPSNEAGSAEATAFESDARHRGPAFERTSARPDTGLAFMDHEQ